MHNSVELFIGDRILYFRKKRDLNQEELAQLLNISRQQLQKYETGITRVPVSILAEISKALGIKTADLMSGIDEISSQRPLSSHGLVTVDRTQPLNILLIEDDAADELLTRTAIELCDEPCVVSSVGDGFAAIELLKSSARGTSPQKLPDVIFLDLNIPKMRGAETLQSIKLNPAIQHIPVVVITHSMTRAEMMRVYKFGACGFIVKSFSPDDYFAKISTVISYWARMVLPYM